MSSFPTSFYAIQPNDDHELHQNFMATTNAGPNTSPGKPFYPSPFDGVLAPSFPNSNNISATQSFPVELPVNGVTDDASLAPMFTTDNTVPNLQNSFPFEMASSLLFSGLSTSSESTLTPSPTTSYGMLPKRTRKSKIIQPKRSSGCFLKGKQIVKIRRTRGSTRKTSKRSTSAGFEDMFHKLPLEVQRALNTFYTGCCESTTNKDNSTRQKHMFSNRHFDNLPKEYVDQLPGFVCPAYIAFHRACTSAKAGRYDSAERHCRACAGFQMMNSKRQMFPLAITKAEYEALRMYRQPDDETKVEEKASRLVRNTVNKLLEMIIGHENVRIDEAECNFSQAIPAICGSLGVM